MNAIETKLNKLRQTVYQKITEEYNSKSINFLLKNCLCRCNHDWYYNKNNIHLKDAYLREHYLLKSKKPKVLNTLNSLEANDNISKMKDVFDAASKLCISISKCGPSSGCKHLEKLVLGIANDVSELLKENLLKEKKLLNKIENFEFLMSNNDSFENATSLMKKIKL